VLVLLGRGKIAGQIINLNSDDDMPRPPILLIVFFIVQRLMSRSESLCLESFGVRLPPICRLVETTVTLSIDLNKGFQDILC
jgi:hypothetical protein